MSEKRFYWWFGLAGLSILASLVLVGWFLTSMLNTFRQGVQTIQETTENTIGPVGDLTSNVATQVELILNPTPTILPDPVAIIRDIRSLARLETIQFSVEKVIRAESQQGPLGFLFGDRLLLVAHGVVIAGIDLNQLTSDDIELNGGTLTIRLPDPEIFVATLNNEKTYVYDRELGALTRGNITLETDARRVAEAEIRKAAIDDGILELARQNAEFYMERLLNNLGYPEVVYLRPEPTPTPRR
jgi:hypothetical protein